MKQIIIILLMSLSSLFVEAKDSTTVKKTNIHEYTTQIDTVKFVNDTAWVVEKPNISHIVYADNSSNSNIITEFLFPIIMLLLGVGIDRFIVWRSDKKKIKKIGKRWIAELKSILTPLENQKDSLNSFIEEYCDKVDKYAIPDITIEQTLDGSQFKVLNKEDLYDFLEESNKDELELLYRKITNIISSLEFTRTQLIGKCNDMLSSSNKYITQFNSYSQDYRLQLSDVLSGHTTAHLKAEDNTELKRLFEATFEKSEEEFNIFKSKDQFVTPSINILSK